MPLFDPTTLILIGSITFVASMVNGLCGFGFALVAVPFMMIFLSPKIVIPLITITSLALDALILFEARRHVEWRKVASLMIPGIAGMLIGIWLLTYLGIGSLKLYIGVIIPLFALASLLEARRGCPTYPLAWRWGGGARLLLTVRWRTRDPGSAGTRNRGRREVMKTMLARNVCDSTVRLP